MTLTLPACFNLNETSFFIRPKIKELVEGEQYFENIKGEENIPAITNYSYLSFNNICHYQYHQI